MLVHTASQSFVLFFFFNDTATTEIYTLSLHDALPILQACRLDTSSPTNPNPFPSGDAYYRATSLDQAPVNAPSGFDFNSANQNFVNNFAYRPANFTNQMGLSGFTPFRRS